MVQMIDVPVGVSTIRRVYSLWSLFYGSLIVPLEKRPRLRGIELAAIQPQDRILEVAVGTGAALLEILKRVDKSNAVCGVDLTPRMLEKAGRTVAKAGFTNLDLRLGDARSLPFGDNTFDLLFNSYMLDLIPLADMPVVLGEFWRVLKKDGRLVMVNMSKEHGITLWERLYQATPARLAPYLYGGCRPVLMEEPAKAAGFGEVQREFVKNIIPSEVLMARK
ncbi:MAG: methyltransferase domain-containing protein [Anaerolineales bacterium]|nr:methyltransferase domain-containing protein [Anaerolineales bacterium]